MSEVYVIEHGSAPRPARIVTMQLKSRHGYVSVEFTDGRGGRRVCLASSVFPTKAEVEAAERKLEASK